MDPTYDGTINYVNPPGGEGLLFTPKYINLEYIFNKIYVFLLKLTGQTTGKINVDVDGSATGIDLASTGGTGVGGGFDWKLFFEDINILFYLIIVILLSIIIYSTIRIFEIRKKEGEFLATEIERYEKEQIAKAEKSAVKGISRNDKWVRVVEHTMSYNENDWRQAIIEADAMLFSMMDKMGFKGETLGDKLKLVNKDNFRHLNLAWEAHAVRNRIAHEGADFILTSREAKRVVSLYEQIFREYDYI